MKVVLADIEEDALEEAADTLSERDKVIAVPTGVARTRIADSARDWPDRLGQIPQARNDEMFFETVLRSLIEGGTEPADVAQQVFSGVQEERLWVLPNAERFGPVIKEVAASAVEGRTPPMVQLA